jgi:poly-beta-1,6-N-acetyl-D-glucosamine synthase
MDQMISFYLFFGIIYVLVLLLLISKFDFSPDRKPIPSSSIFVSIVVPFRNEEKNLPILFQHLNSQSHQHFEVIWVNDDSTDQSEEVLRKLMLTTSTPSKLIQNKGKAKKGALLTGIEISRGEIICTTDADCIPSPNWLACILAAYSLPHINMVAGPVMTKSSHFWWDNFQSADWASIVLVSNFFFNTHKPLMCSGANLFFRKSCFFEVNGYAGNEEILSGDDEFLLKKFYIKYGASSIKYVSNPSAVVVTRAHDNLSSMISQRIRWASKWKHHQSGYHAIAAFVPFLVQVLFLLSFLLLSRGVGGQMTFLGLWGSKWMAEKNVLGKVSNHYQSSIPSKHWPVITLFHPFYVLITAIGALRGKYAWKGRNQMLKR